MVEVSQLPEESALADAWAPDDRNAHGSRSYPKWSEPLSIPSPGRAEGCGNLSPRRHACLSPPQPSSRGAFTISGWSRRPSTILPRSWRGLARCRRRIIPAPNGASACGPHGVTDAIVEQAFTEGRILRTHVLRPTWHFVPPADIRWMLSIERTTRSSRPVVLSIDSVSSTRDVLSEATPSSSARFEAGITRPGRSCRQRSNAPAFAPTDPTGMSDDVRRARRRHLQRPEARQPVHLCAAGGARAARAHPWRATKALAALARRYFTSRGPATVRDYVWWSGLTVSDARNGIEMAGSALVSDVVDGRTYWFSSARQAVRSSALTTFLMPNYDEFAIAYRDRGDRAVDPSAAQHRGAGHLRALAVRRWTARRTLEAPCAERPGRDRRAAVPPAHKTRNERARDIRGALRQIPRSRHDLASRPSLVLSPSSLVSCPQSTVLRRRTGVQDRGPRTIDHGLWTSDPGLWTMDYGPVTRTTDQGPATTRIAAPGSDRCGWRGARGSGRRRPTPASAAPPSQTAIHGSRGWMPYSCVETKRPERRSPRECRWRGRSPSSSSTSLITIQMTPPGCAPSARRMPSSFLRRATTNAITPYRPIDASTRREQAEAGGQRARSADRCSSVSSSCPSTRLHRVDRHRRVELLAPRCGSCRKPLPSRCSVRT